MATNRGFLAVFVVFALTGCASQDAILTKQSELEYRVESLAKANNLSNVQISMLFNELKDLQNEVKANSAAIRELRDTVADLRAAVGSMRARQTAAPPEDSNRKIELINKDEPAPSKNRAGVGSEAYMKAFGLYSADKYEEAIESFNAFIKAYPDSEYAVNAQYWIGECHYTRSNLPQALEAFKKVISGYPGGSKVPDAMLKAGYTLYALKQNDSAAAMLQNLVSSYPESPAAAKARERLGRESVL